MAPWESATYRSPAQGTPEHDLPHDAVITVPLAGGIIEVALLSTGIRVRQVGGNAHRHLVVSATAGNTLVLTLANNAD
jgi:hypothetical protein